MVRAAVSVSLSEDCVSGLELDYRGEIFQDLASFDDDINDGTRDRMSSLR